MSIDRFGPIKNDKNEVSDSILTLHFLRIVYSIEQAIDIRLFEWSICASIRIQSTLR